MTLSQSGLKGQGDKGSVLTSEEISRYKLQVEDLVKYFEGTINFIGNPKSVTKEKEIIINDSYLKIFKDDKVQVEDDLDESREVPIHKDVQAYLKDIEFFFRSVKFSFHVSDITFNSGDNMNYFKVTMNRDLEGITIEGDTVANRKVRFMEINLDIASNDLRIASLYTTKLNEKEEIRNWWNGLSVAWRNFLGAGEVVYDTVNLSDVFFIADSLLLISKEEGIQSSDSTGSFDVELPTERQASLNAQHLDSLYADPAEVFLKLSVIIKQTTVDISGNEAIRTLEPLAELSELIDLNCANTFITDLFPLRNLNHLVTLDVSNTPVDDISPLQYSTSLKDLNCSYTLLENLLPLSGLYNLEKLSCSGLRINNPDFAKGMLNLKELNLSETKIYDLSSISGLLKLEELDLSESGITDLNEVAVFTSLKYLNAEGTSVSSAVPLSALLNLEILKISNTAIEDLGPLDELPNIKRIYWDSNGDFSVDKEKRKEEAISFMSNHPGSLVIFESEALMSAWASLEEPWKVFASDLVGLSENPTKEELHAMLQIEELNLEGVPVTTLNPVANLYNLNTLSCPGLKVEDYSPIGHALELEYLDISNTSVQSLEFASSLNQLIEIHIEGTSVTDLSPLNELKALKYVYADNSGVVDEAAKSLRTNNPDCIIIYKTDGLQAWWDALSMPWKDFFTAGFKMDSPPSKEQLHQLFYLTELEISNNQGIVSFEPVKQLVYLKRIKFSQLTTGDLQFVSGLLGLEELHCTQMPVSNLAAVSSQKSLEVLNLENTPIEDLKPLSPLVNLKELVVSGTQISSLKPVSALVNLESIELNNTQVKSISSLFGIGTLKSVSCFNTRVSSKNIEKLKKEKPGCKVVYY